MLSVDPLAQQLLERQRPVRRFGFRVDQGLGFKVQGSGLYNPLYNPDI